MSQSLTVTQNSFVGLPSEHEMMVYHTVAEHAVTSKMYSNNLRDKSAVMMIMLAARELGVPPMQSLNGGLNIINGKVEISARMMNALIRKSGYKITIKESSDKNCKLLGERIDTGECLTVSFSFEEAQKAGLVKPNSGWLKWPIDMCFARALSRLARQLFSDVIGIGYVEGEIRESNDVIVMPTDIENSKDTSKNKSISSENSLETLCENFSLENLLKLFPTEDHKLVNEYMQVVMNHFNWTEEQCIRKFLEEKEVVEKFNAWKVKKLIEKK